MTISESVFHDANTWLTNIVLSDVRKIAYNSVGNALWWTINVTVHNPADIPVYHFMARLIDPAHTW